MTCRFHLTAIHWWTIFLAAPLGAQDFLVPIPVPPSGFVGQPAFVDVGMELASGLSYGLAGSLAYDSNIGSGSALSSSGGAGEEESDTILTLSPTINYRNPGGDFTFGGSFTLNNATYFNNSDLGGLGYNFNLNTGYKGGRFQLSNTFSSSLIQGSNIYFDNTNTEILYFNTGVSLNYTLSPKTSINSTFSYSWTEPTEDVFSTTYNTGINVAAMWRYSALTSIGPGVAWSLSGGDNQPDLQTLGPTVNITYRLSTKVSANGTFGMQFYDSEIDDGEDSGFTTNLALNYRASALWGMNLAVLKGTTANGGIDGGFQDTTSFRVGYNRKIRRANLKLGTSYQTRELSGTSATATDSRDNLSFDTSLGMPVFSNRANASIFYNWRDSSGDTNQSADGSRVGISLSTAF